jgi:proton-dependent oligopeptide transporter, POT family
MSSSDLAATPQALPGPTLFGQPRGLATLFLTEMWERFTYYGMRAVLILFLTEKIGKGGLGIDDQTASAIYGLYIAGTYLFSPLGGWIADRLIGAQRAVMAGAGLIIIGNVMLISGTAQIFFLGLLIIVFGVGLLKPNVSSLVATLYPEGGTRRDAGFSIFYMGINLGATVGSILVPIVQQIYGYHPAFALGAVVMALGLIQMVFTRHYLGGAGLAPAGASASWVPVGAFLAVTALLVVLLMTGTLHVDPRLLGGSATWLMALVAAGYFAYLLQAAGGNRAERGRVWVMAALFAASALFWAGYEQAGDSFNLFAERYTNLHLALSWPAQWSYDVPAGTLQAINPFFVIVFAPVFAGVWLWLGRRHLDPSPPAKLGGALLLLGAGFLVMYMASRYVLAGQIVAPTWLLTTYLLHTFGELCLSPVGMSSVSKLAPARFTGQVMGLWFLSIALGNNMAGQLSSEYDGNHIETLPALFLKVFWFSMGSGWLMLLVTPALKRLMARDKPGPGNPADIAAPG